MIKIPSLCFEDFLRLYHHLNPDDVVISDVRGFWDVKEPCPGGESCRHAFRVALGPCQGGKKLSIMYIEPDARDDKGRFASPYREWYRQRSKAK